MTGRTETGPESGIVLVMMLWVLTILMVMVLSFSFATQTDTLSTLSFKERIENRLLAEAGVQRGIMELLYRKTNKSGQVVFEGNEVLRTDGTPYTFEVGTGHYTIRVTDESGKININSLTDLSAPLLNSLLVSLGVAEEEAAVIVDSILDWKDPDNLHRLHGAEDEYYMSLPQPYKAKNGLFDTLEELLLVRGMSPAILFGDEKRPGLIAFLTVYSNASAINVNAASREVLKSIPHMTPDMVERIIESRRAGEVTDLRTIPSVTDEVATLMAPYIGYGESSMYTIETTGFKEDRRIRFGIRATVLADGTDQVRYVYYKSPASIR
jgi:general secretion pathway protein K